MFTLYRIGFHYFKYRRSQYAWLVTSIWLITFIPPLDLKNYIFKKKKGIFHADENLSQKVAGCLLLIEYLNELVIL